MEKILEPITPGEILLKEFLKPLGITQNQLAIYIKVPANRINQIVNGKREISVDTAIRLSKFFGNSAEFWLNLQGRYNLKIATKHSKLISKSIKSFKEIVRK
jgi:addiction module HigA family antidote